MKRCWITLCLITLFTTLASLGHSAGESVYNKCSGGAVGEEDPYFIGNVVKLPNFPEGYDFYTLTAKSGTTTYSLTQMREHWYLHSKFNDPDIEGVGTKAWNYQVSYHRRVPGGLQTIGPITINTRPLGKPQRTDLPWCAKKGPIEDADDPNGVYTGLQLYDGTSMVPIAFNTPDTNDAINLKMYMPYADDNNKNDWKPMLVDESDPSASKFRIVLAANNIKALKLYTEVPINNTSTPLPSRTCSTPCSPICSGGKTVQIGACVSGACQYSSVTTTEDYTINQVTASPPADQNNKCLGGPCGNTTCGSNKSCKTIQFVTTDSSLNNICPFQYECVDNPNCMACPTSSPFTSASLCPGTTPTSQSMASPILVSNGACPTDKTICAYQCPVNSVKSGTTCSQIVYQCMGAIPANAEECVLNQSIALTSNSTRAYVNSCIGNTAACKFSCKATFTYNTTTKTCECPTGTSLDTATNTCKSTTGNAVCGNGILEAGEDCDPKAGSPAPTCGMPGQEFTCNRATCRYECPAGGCREGDDCKLWAKCTFSGTCTFVTVDAAGDDNDSFSASGSVAITLETVWGEKAIPREGLSDYMCGAYTNCCPRGSMNGAPRTKVATCTTSAIAPTKAGEPPTASVDNATALFSMPAYNDGNVTLPMVDYTCSHSPNPRNSCVGAQCDVWEGSTETTTIIQPYSSAAPNSTDYYCCGYPQDSGDNSFMHKCEDIPTGE